MRASLCFNEIVEIFEVFSVTGVENDQERRTGVGTLEATQLLLRFRIDY
jgi:hypothetical protein